MFIYKSSELFDKFIFIFEHLVLSFSSGPKSKMMDDITFFIIIEFGFQVSSYSDALEQSVKLLWSN